MVTVNEAMVILVQRKIKLSKLGKAGSCVLLLMGIFFDKNLATRKEDLLS